VLRASLQSGSYFAGLSSWSLEKQRADGTFAPVQALLASSSFVTFAIENGTTTTISFKFQTDGIIVEIGRGDLVVDVDVEEVPPVCAPLGSGCADGAWCPPPELTGTAIACAVAGPVAVGEPCNAPTDCVANATCIDPGEGPVCAALCASSAFGVACDSGGTCEAAGMTYGVCR
jgi:hypothetical protein